MPTYDFAAQRLFVDAPLHAGARAAASAEQTNYLVNVLRLGVGDCILVFNGRDGEWRARVKDIAKRAAVLLAEEQTRPQSNGPDLDYLFAPLKRARLDYMAQKAVEMGVARLRPVMTRRTVAERVNLERLRSNAIEAAEQCGIMRLPEIHEPAKLDRVLAAWEPSRRLIFCDEGAEIANPIATLSAIPSGPLALLIGPEGGFTPDERELLLSRPFTTALSLGPRVLRADTAAVAALALVNAALGDWRAG